MDDTVLDFESKHKKDACRFAVKEYLLLGGGPTNCSDRVLRALAMQCLAPMTPNTFDIIEDVKVMLKYVFQTENRFTLASQTSGNGVNESILVNLLEPGDKVVIAIGGFWGEKTLNIAQRHGYDVLPLRKPVGEIFTIEELEEAVSTHKAKMLFVTHGETTGGILQKLEGLGPMCHKYDCLFAADAVASIGVDPLFVDRWELDAVSAGSQKAIGAPPGMCMLTFSPRAEKRMAEKKTQPPYYLDVRGLSTYWKCTEAPRGYHYTVSSNMLSAIREALAQICEEGLTEMWKRHKTNAQYFWKKLDELGLEFVVKKPENRFTGVTCIKAPEGIDEDKLLDFLREKYSIDTTIYNGALRIGFMGQNSRLEVIDYLMDALKDGLNQCQCQK